MKIQQSNQEPFTGLLDVIYMNDNITFNQEPFTGLLDVI